MEYLVNNQMNESLGNDLVNENELEELYGGDCVVYDVCICRTRGGTYADEDDENIVF